MEKPEEVAPITLSPPPPSLPEFHSETLGNPEEILAALDPVELAYTALVGAIDNLAWATSQADPGAFPVSFLGLLATAQLQYISSQREPLPMLAGLGCGLQNGAQALVEAGGGQPRALN